MTFSETFVRAMFWAVFGGFWAAQIYWFIRPDKLTVERMIWSGAYVITFVTLTHLLTGVQ